jgi:hypothetical protein
MILTSTLTCPSCGERSTETMPENACVQIYDCQVCGHRMTPKTQQGDCCVFCSYGDIPCPPRQNEHT